MTVAPGVGTVLAHGVGGRQDLPIPFSYALWGAAVTLVVSFLLLGVLWRSPRLRGEWAGHALPHGVQGFLDGAPFRWALRLAGLAVTGYVVVAAVFGPDLATNPTAGAVYVLLWVGLVPASVLLGPVWRLLNPLRTLHLLLSRALGTAPDEGLRPLPSGVGYWPAAAGLLAFVWLELVAPDRATLPVLRTWFALYAGIHLIAAAVYGSRWFDRGDAFEVWSDFFGRLSPLGRRADGRLVLRSPLDGMAPLRPAPGLVAVVSVMLGSTAYDGISNAPFWVARVQSSAAPTLAGTLGLLALVLVVGLAYAAATSVSGRLGLAPDHEAVRVRERVDATAGVGARGGAGAGGTRGASARGGRREAATTLRRLPGAFAHTIVPIALGYVVAHYYSLLLLEGQRTVMQLSDPFSDGSDVFGTAERGVDATLVTPTIVATTQVAAVVLGHVLGVVLAHDRAVRLFPRRQALAGQLPLLVLMVAYTVGGLLLLFGA